MNSTYKPHLAEVKAYFYNGDTHLGYRRLLDAAIETQNPDIYAATLSFCDWYDAWSNTKPADSNDLNINVNELLGKIDQVPQPLQEASSCRRPAYQKNTVRVLSALPGWMWPCMPVK
jgi:hypothetical protein